MGKYFTFIVITLFCVVKSIGQNSGYASYTRSTHFDLSDGLSHNQVYQSYQDKRGFLWLVTANGLNLFDGRSSKLVKSWPLLQSPHELKICGEDAGGQLWLIRSGVAGLDVFTVNQYSRIVKDWREVLPQNLINSPTGVAFGPEGSLLIINDRGEIWEKGKLSEWKLKCQTLDAGWQFVQERNDLRITWISRKLKGPENDFVTTEFIALGAEGQQLSRTTIEGVRKSIVLNKNELWLLCKNKVVILHADGDITNQIETSKLFPGIELRDLVFSFNAEKDLVWVHNRKVLSAHSVDHFKRGDLSQPMLKADNRVNVFHMSQGKRGLIFVGASNGIHCLEVLPQRFQRLIWQNPTESNLGLMKEVRGICSAGKNKVIFQAGDWVYLHDLLTKETQKVLPTNQGISAVTQDSQEKLWMGYGKSLVEMDGKTGKIVFNPFPSDFDHYFLWSILDNGPQLLIGSSVCLWEYIKSDRTFQLFSRYNQYEELRGRDIYWMRSEPGGLVWILSEIGLYKLDLEKGIVDKFGSSEKGSKYLPSDNFRHYYRDKKGTYWFATANGLLRWDPQTGVYRLFSTSDGLPNDNLYAVYPDNDGNLWMSSDYGIIQLSPASGLVRYFLQEDGITHNEFNRIAHYKDEDGMIYFGGINGLTYFDPKAFSLDENERMGYGLALVQGVARNNEGDSRDDLLALYVNNQKIVINPWEKLVSLDFSFPNYSNSKFVNYRYRIEGLSDEWIVTRNSTIQLLGLAPGSYKLFIAATSGDGSTSKEELIIPIYVRPPFYRTWWFALFMLLILGLTFRIGLIYREKQLKERQIQLEEEVKKSTAKIRSDKELIEQQAKQLAIQNEERTRFFANVSHEFRTPLSLILGPINVVKQQPKISNRLRSLLEIAQNNAKRLLELVDGIMVISTLDTAAFKKREEKVMVSLFITEIREEFWLLADQKKIEFECENNGTSNLEIVVDPRLLRLILSNLLSNALKFSREGGRILLRTSAEDDQVVFEVIDSGRGIPSEDLPFIFNRYFQTSLSDAAAEGGTGIGLALVSELLELLGGSVAVKSELGVGSHFTFRIPKGDSSGIISNYGSSLAEKKSRSEKIKSQPYIKSGYSLLIVEDSIDLQQYLDFLLNETYAIHLASNGVEALKLLNEGLQPDLIITDMMMPEMDGLQLTKQLKNNHKTAKIPIILLTARSSGSDYFAALQLGIDDYLLKPFDEQGLFSTIKQLIKRAVERQLEVEKEKGGDGDRQKEEAAWIQRLKEATIKGMGSDVFSVDQLAATMLMGRTSFYKEVKRLTGLTPNEYILEARLIKARTLMETESNLSLAKIIQLVGLKDEGNFVKSFKKRFGNPPSWYM